MQWVVPGKICRGPRMQTASDMRVLRNMGIRTILNLESGLFEILTRDTQEQDQNARDFGIDVIHHPLSFLLPPWPYVVGDAIDKMDDERYYPMYVHCYHGKDRTGFVCAAFRMHIQGWTFEQAYQEMLALGFHWWYRYWVPELRSWDDEEGL